MHPALFLALWFWLAVLLASLERHFLFGIASLLLASGFFLVRQRFLKAVLRMRWLLLAVLVVYGWSTPGWYVWAGFLSPTREGLLLGLEQVLRLLALVSSLQFLLTRLNRNGIFAGLYCLFFPLCLLGIKREKMAVRLALTIAFADELLEKKTGFHELLSRPCAAGGAGNPDVILLPVRPLSLLDGFFLFLTASGVVLSVCYLGNHSWP